MTRIEKKSVYIGVASLLFLVLALPLSAGETRPIRDDIGFFWTAGAMDRLLAYLESTLPEDKNTALPPLVAGISAHDDYLYAAQVYYPLYRHFKAKEVVVFGVTHRAIKDKIGDPQAKIIFDTYSHWQGPYGPVGVSKLREYLKEKLDKEIFLENNEAHDLEHSIEAQVPFLQYFNREIKITPIMVTGMDFPAMERISAALATAITSYIRENNLAVGKDIFFLISADANHYGKDFDNVIYGQDERAHQLGIASDIEIVHTFLTGTISPALIRRFTERLWGKTYLEYNDRYWCGRYSIPFGLLTVGEIMNRLYPGKSLTGQLLRYADTYTDGVLPLKKTGYGITAPFSLKHWVGFFSVAFFLE